MPFRRQCFPGKLRLKGRADYQRVYNNGVRIRGRHLVLFVARTEGAVSRFGVTASRRVGNAVVRARCKRRLRELYRLHRSHSGRVSLDVVANAHSSCADAPWPELEREFVRCLRQGETRAKDGPALPEEQQRRTR
ncbi:MAG: ribonuclease P protein component [Thermoanaerobaculales bacterium]